MITIVQSHRVAAPRSAVAAALLDPEILRSAIPGCREVRRVDATTFWALADVGILAMRFDIDATLNVVPTSGGYRIAGSVRAGPVKAGDVEADVVLTETAGATTVASTTTLRPARPHSKITLGAGKIVARKLTDAFFSELGKRSERSKKAEMPVSEEKEISSEPVKAASPGRRRRRSSV